MSLFRRWLAVFALVLAGLAPVNAELDPGERFPVHEGPLTIWVHSIAPIPSEVENETQARALSRDAAIVQGQAALMNHVLKKKTRSNKPLSVAQEPSLELQQEVAGFIKGAKISKTQWGKKDCTVTLELSKKRLGAILKKG